MKPSKGSNETVTTVSVSIVLDMTTQAHCAYQVRAPCSRTGVSTATSLHKKYYIVCRIYALLYFPDFARPYMYTVAWHGVVKMMLSCRFAVSSIRRLTCSIRNAGSVHS